MTEARQEPHAIGDVLEEASQVRVALTHVSENKNREVHRTGRSLPRDVLASVATGFGVQASKPSFMSVRRPDSKEGRLLT